MKSNIVRAAFCLVLIGTMLVTLQSACDNPGSLEISRFSSYQELKEFVNTNTQDKGMLNMPDRFWSGAAEEDAPAPAPAESDYSTTNIQVAGVDEMVCPSPHAYIPEPFNVEWVESNQERHHKIIDRSIP